MKAPRRRAESGLTLIELIFTLAVIVIVAALAFPAVGQILARAKIRRAIADMRMIEVEIGRYEVDEGAFPSELEDLPMPLVLDPWGREYRYLLFEGPGWRGRARKDRFLVPINSNYDLYSVGADGESRPPLQNRFSHDDVIRANDGGFYGLARDF